MANFCSTIFIFIFCRGGGGGGGGVAIKIHMENMHLMKWNAIQMEELF